MSAYSSTRVLLCEADHACLNALPRAGFSLLSISGWTPCMKLTFTASSHLIDISHSFCTLENFCDNAFCSAYAEGPRCRVAYEWSLLRWDTPRAASHLACKILVAVPSHGGLAAALQLTSRRCTSMVRLRHGGDRAGRRQAALLVVLLSALVAAFMWKFSVVSSDTLIAYSQVKGA